MNSPLAVPGAAPELQSAAKAVDMSPKRKMAVENCLRDGGGNMGWRNMMIFWLFFSGYVVECCC